MHSLKAALGTGRFGEAFPDIEVEKKEDLVMYFLKAVLGIFTFRNGIVKGAVETSIFGALLAESCTINNQIWWCIS